MNGRASSVSCRVYKGQGKFVFRELVPVGEFKCEALRGMIFRAVRDVAAHFHPIMSADDVS